MNKEIFREYDIRGIAGKDLNDDVVEKIGKGFGTYISRLGGKNIIVGHDSRLTSPEYKDMIVKGILSTGCDVIDLGEVPTPLLYFSMIHLAKDGGIVITASHNPKEYNGFKMRNKDKAVFGEEIQKVREIIESGNFAQGEGSREEYDIKNEYISAVTQRVKLGRKLKVVVDAGNGTTGLVAPQLLKKLGCELIEMYCKPDGNFPNHLADPTVVKYVKDLCEKVVQEKADVGIAYDGDGDRVGIVDEKGNLIFSDKLMILFAREILKRGPAPIVFDVKSSQALVEDILKNKGEPVMWRTGYPLMQSKMYEVNAPLAGEMSGHIYFADNYYGFDDGMFASVRLLEILSNKDEPMSHLLSDVPYYPSTPEMRIKHSDSEKFQTVEKVAQYFKKHYDVIDIDGVRILFEDGWGLIRASNTQAILVLRFEAKTEERLKEIMAIVKEKLNEYSSIPVDF